jgi:creatinine amidohydrolase/Fe(II)-dependent formamide hydrolase-like protein
MPGVEVPWPKADDGHAGPGETSQMLALRPELVNVELMAKGAHLIGCKLCVKRACRLASGR